jgi:phenylacetate-coenzyme A ligase PaaK-like adenylate-forming protein
MNFEQILKKDIINYNIKFKEKIFLSHQKFLTKFHYERCYEYKKILNSKSIKISKIKKLEEIPYLPTKIFKDYSLKSIQNNQIVRIMNSSGTSNNNLSKIILDKDTSINQIKVLSKIVKSVIGDSRLPTIIIDTKKFIADKNKFSARIAGILGFSNFSKHTLFALNENMKLDFNNILKFLKKYKNQKILIFGFTYLVYENFLQYLIKNKKKIDLSKAIMIHGGGWKKLTNLNISNKEFKLQLRKITKINTIYNYYGMIEQTGSIFIECNKGNFHASLFNDIIIRNHNNFKVNKTGEKGIIQIFSLIPKSYPGHSILTEDEGIILGEGNCGCGNKSKYFNVLGRMENSEIRGCSDVYR